MGRVIAVPKKFIEFLGFMPAVLMNQVLYWSDRTKSSDGIFHKSIPEFSEELGLSKHIIGKARKSLEEQGYIKTEVTNYFFKRTISWRATPKFLADFEDFIKQQIYESETSFRAQYAA